MALLKKKHAHLGLIVTLIGVVVVLLYPMGSKILKMIQNHDYPIVYGKEIIYSNIATGDIRVADGILENRYEISRFEPVVINKQTWKEDPFSDIYWRFNYYNLEPVRNLLFAWQKTGKPEYKDNLIQITESFLDKGQKGQYSWDYHGVAFRAMTLISVQAKLREKNELSPELDKKILASLKVHGNFLADPTHFEKDYNHGLDQAAALFLLAANFPDMKGADSWYKLASKRIAESQANIIDEDGVLVENSPYYHLYVLEKFLEINKYLKQNNLTIDGFSEEKLDKMVSYVVYMLQPDLSVSTVGASITRQINLFGLYKEIAEKRPDLLYVLTQGEEGEKPAKLNIRYPSGGQTIMRSAWNNKNGYVNQTQVIFDVGNYRTNHSDLDALSFNLFGGGIALMPDAGLYTYEEGSYRSYFHGTRSHNTVVVDGKDQSAGLESSTQPKKVFAGFFEEGDGYVYQSGQNILYDGVSHERAIVLIEDSTVLVLDNLKSSAPHTYEQMFHLFPGARVTTDGLTLKAEGSDPKQSLTIKQFATDGLKLSTAINKQKPLDGQCSVQYKVAIPCHSISYAKKGNSVSYVTAINIGQNAANVTFRQDKNLVIVTTKKGEYTVKIDRTENVERSIDVKKNYDANQSNSSIQQIDSLNTSIGWEEVSEFISGVVGGSLSVNQKENSLGITTASDGSHFGIEKKVNLDLSNHNIYFQFKVDRIFSLQGVDLYLSNDNWATYAKFNVKSIIPDPEEDINRNNTWINFGVAKGDLRKVELGNWTKKDSSFDWSKVDGIKIVATAKQGKVAKVNIHEFRLVPDQKEARAVIVFDDGWASVMDAAQIMNKYGVKGNVAMVTGSVDTKRYLTLDNLKTLQSEYGWNVVSHSSLHKNAVLEYVHEDNIEGFTNDVMDALYYLIKNDLNSAPNWYVYPDGSIDNSTRAIIGKYYKYARATIAVPVAFPFADSLAVGTFGMYSNTAQSTDAHNAVSDAIKYKQTLFLMFHKISKGPASQHTEFSLRDFETVIKDMKRQGIRIMTLSELDRGNGIPQTEFVLHEAVPAQFKLDILSSRFPRTIWSTILDGWMNLTGRGS
ncbi:MAG: heparinase II/III family protein [bacterium]|nr:heparinase II/III family protein [bacterium]